jgi:hypothetical protein
MKLKLHNKTIEIVDIEMGGVDTGDWGDFSDAFIAEASEQLADGTFRDLTEDECAYLTEENPVEVNGLAMEWALP